MGVTVSSAVGSERVTISPSLLVSSSPSLAVLLSPTTALLTLGTVLFPFLPTHFLLEAPRLAGPARR